MIKFLIVLTISFPLSATVVEMGVSSVKTSSNKSWFTIQKDEEPGKIEVIVKDEHNELLSLETIITSQAPFTSYEWQQFQTKEHVKIKREGHTLHFNYKSSPDDKGSTKTIKVSDYELERLTLPPLLTTLIQSKVEKNPSVKKFDLLIVVPDKMLLLKFNFTQKNNDDEIEWLLSPDSFFVGLIVSPVKFVFDKKMKIKRIKEILMPVKFKDHTGNLSNKKTDLDFTTN